jgi:EpsI family protein
MITKSWIAAGLLATGALFTVGIDSQKVVPLRAPLATTVPVSLGDGLVGKDATVSKEEQAVAGMDQYVMRFFAPANAAAADAYSYSVYVGYYETQRQGNTIHSPKNCLPGAGWEALQSTTVPIPTDNGAVRVNQYLLKRKGQEAVVLYWYQGRGRVAANEYAVKWQLLRDAALRGRSDEALVRVIVPVTGSETEAVATAVRVATRIVPAVYRALPEGA